MYFREMFKIIITCLVFLSGLIMGSQIQAQCIDSMIVSDAEAAPGDMGIHVPIYGRVCGYEGEDLDGFTTPLVWDTSAFELDTALYEVTDPVYSSFYDEIAVPNQWAVDIRNGEGWAVVAVVFRYGGDPDISPGRYRMFDLVFNVREAAIPGEYTIELAEDIGTPPKDPTFTYYYFDVPVEQKDGVFIVLGEAYGAISGTVVNSENLDPIEDAYVQANGFSEQTNEDGEYLISNLPAGMYNVIASAIGFEPDTVEGVEVIVGQTANVDFELTPSECVNTLFSGDGSGIGGDTIRVAITAMNCSELDGYTVSLAYPHQFLRAIAIDTTGTATGDVSPDSFRYKLVLAGGEILPGFVLVQCVVSFDHSRAIPVGTNKLFDILFEVKPNPPDTADFQFMTYPEVQWPDSGLIENEFIFGDFHFTPNLANGQFIMLPAFMRGDCNGDGVYLLGDGLYILNYYIGAVPIEPPTCTDAFDYNDDGSITLGDGLGFLTWYCGTSGASPPASPWMHCGVDPTPGDSFECVWHATCMSEDGVLAKLRREPYSVNESDNEVIIEAKEGSKNYEVVASVDIVNNEELSGFEFSVLYDPRVFSVTAVNNSSLVSEDFDFFVVDVSKAGNVRVSCVPDFEMKKGLEKGDNEIAEIAFKIRDPVLSSNALIQLDNVWLYNEAVEVVPAQWIDAIVKIDGSLPDGFHLWQNHPNPFNSATEIRYDLPRSYQVRIDIFNLLGQKVATLVDESKSAGIWRTIWNGNNDRGEKVTSGIYFCRMEVGKFQAIRQMLYLK
jgi:hypothetical protein